MLQMESSVGMHCPGRSGAKMPWRLEAAPAVSWAVWRGMRDPLLTAFWIQAQNRALMWLRPAVIHGLFTFRSLAGISALRITPRANFVALFSTSVMICYSSSPQKLQPCSARMWVVIKMNLNYGRVTERKQNYWQKTEPWLCSVEKINQIYGTVKTTWWQTFGKCQH